MLNFSKEKLAGKPALFRYAYFLVSSCRYKSFRAWKRDGEPNPFVTKTYRHTVTERVEFTDIFDDLLDSQRRRSRNRSHSAI